MTYTERRVLIEELTEIRNALEKADYTSKDYFVDSEPCSRDRRLAMALYPSIEDLLALVDDRLDDLLHLDSLPE